MGDRDRPSGKGNVDGAPEAFRSLCQRASAPPRALLDRAGLSRAAAQPGAARVADGFATDPARRLADHDR